MIPLATPTLKSTPYPAASLDHPERSVKQVNRLPIILFLLVLALGCSRAQFPEPQFGEAVEQLKSVDRAKLISDAQAMMNTRKWPDPVPREMQPESIQALKPHMVHVYSYDSVLIVLKKMGGKESGLMIRRNGDAPIWPDTNTFY